MTMSAPVGLSGRYKFVKRKLTGELVAELEFANVITDVGLNRWGTGSIGDYCKLGSGNTTPSTSDTALASQLLSTTSTVTLSNFRAYSAASRWVEATQVYRFTPGVVVNSIAEVGIGWSTGLWSRALIRDAGGNPITIQILADEVLDVYYTLRIQFPAADITGTITLDGVSYDWAMRPASLSSTPSYPSSWFSGSFGGYNQGYAGATASTATLTAVDSLPTANSYGDQTTIEAYAADSQKQRITYKFDLGSANFGIKTITVRAYGATYATVEWQLGFFQGGSPVGVPKTSSKRLQLTFDFSWGRG